MNKEIKITVSESVYNKLNELAESENVSLEKFMSTSVIRRAEYEHKLKQLDRIFANMNTTFEHYQNIKGRP